MEKLSAYAILKWCRHCLIQEDWGGKDSSVGLATRNGLIVRGSNPRGGDIFCACPDRSRDPVSLLYNG